MKLKLKKLIAWLPLLTLLPLLTFASWEMDFDELWATAGKQPKTLTFQYTDTYPATITIGGSNYGQPADPSQALVDAGDGMFVPWTSNTITLKGNRVRFRGDWRNSSGDFRDLFNGTFADGNDVTMSGGFDFDGVPALHMFRSTFNGCGNLTDSIPSGLFGNISGAPAGYMFYATFNGCSNLTGSIPSGLFGNLSGVPALHMFRETFTNCSNLTGSIPSGLFGNLSGAPADYMFYNTFRRCSNLTGESALMPDGVTHLYEQFPTASGTECSLCYFGATELDDYADIPVAWR